MSNGWRRRLLAASAGSLALILTLQGSGSERVAHGQAPPVLDTFAIRGATILTVTAGTIEAGTIVVRDGRIAAVGPDVAVPPGVEVVDGIGRFVSPGIVDAHAHMPADSINEGGTTVSSMTRIGDVLNPTDINLYRDLAGGVTVANVLHGSANPIGGQSSVIKLRWGASRASELLFEGALPGIKFALGENPTRSGRAALGQPRPLRYPASRPGVEFVIRDAFTRARAYQAEWADYERRRAAGDDPLEPRRDLQLEPLVEILEGQRLVHAHSYRADEILMLLRLAEELGFRIATLQHVLEGYKVAKEIAAHGAGASTFADWWGYKIEAVDAIPYNAAIMHEKGVLVSINSDSAEHSRRLNVEAAKTIRWGGLSADAALALITINPARQLRIDDRVGSLEVGKDADLVIWNRHPLSTYAIVDRTYVDGRLYYDRDADLDRLTRLRLEKAELVRAESATDSDGPPTSQNSTDLSPRSAAAVGAVGTSGRTPAPSDAPAAAGRRTQAPSESSTAITNARIVPVVGDPIERGTLVMRGDRIVALGPDVDIPAGATIVDAAGGHVYPGWVNAWTTIGLSDPGPGGFADAAEIHDLNPHLRTRVAFHNDSDAIPVARAAGLTTVGVAPIGGLLGGQVAVMTLDGWTWEESTLRPVAGISFQFPRLAPSSFGPQASARSRPFGELKQERDAKLAELEHALDRARAYARVPEAERQTDWMLQALVPVVQGELPLFTTARTEREIVDAVEFAERADVAIVLVDAIEAPLVAELLAERDIPVLLGPILTLPTREDMFHAASYQAAGRLAEAGVRFALTTGPRGGSGAPEWSGRQLPFNAAMSVAWGLDRDRAVRAITLDAARILGVGDAVGSLEPGKLANLFIATGDPLEASTSITRVFVAGRDVPLDNKQLALYERYRARR